MKTTSRLMLTAGFLGCALLAEGEVRELKRTYFKKFAKVVPAKKAAQFFQLENQINAALDVRLAAALPLIK